MSRMGACTIGPWRGGLAMAVAAALLLGTTAAAAGGYDRIGEASWYGARYQGRSTASGEPFDADALTAAHPHLPFGSLVRVTNLANGRAVVVRVNDRGPYARGRLIDLSRRAAAQLGFAQAGVARVRVQALPGAPALAEAPALRPPPSEDAIRESLRIARPWQPVRLRPPPGMR